MLRFFLIIFVIFMLKKPINEKRRDRFFLNLKKQLPFRLKRSQYVQVFDQRNNVDRQTAVVFLLKQRSARMCGAVDGCQNGFQHVVRPIGPVGRQTEQMVVVQRCHLPATRTGRRKTTGRTFVKLRFFFYRGRVLTDRSQVRLPEP